MPETYIELTDIIIYYFLYLDIDRLSEKPSSIHQDVNCDNESKKSGRSIQDEIKYSQEKRYSEEDINKDEYIDSNTTEVLREKNYEGNLIFLLEKIRYRIIIPEFYVIQICKHGRSVVIG